MASTIEIAAWGPRDMHFVGALVSDREKGLTIGASATCDWVVAEAGAAPMHAELVALGDDVWICATEPVWLEERMIHGWARLYATAMLRVGTCELRLEFSGRAVGRGRRELPTPVDAQAFPPEAPTRVVNPVCGPLPSPTSTLPLKRDAPPDLSARFALPPVEAPATKSTRPSNPLSLLNQRWGRLSGRWWLAVFSSSVGLLVALTKPSVMSAHAERTEAGHPAVQQQSTAAPTTNIAPAPPPQAPSPALPIPPPSLDPQEAAAALMRNDDVVAWRAYRALAANNPQYLPFVTVLTKRVRAMCEAGRAAPSDCDELR